MLSLPNFRLARALSFILWRGGPIIRPALGMAPALMVRAIAGAAGGSVFRFFLGGAGELRGHRGNVRVSTTGVDVSAIDFSQVHQRPVAAKISSERVHRG